MTKKSRAPRTTINVSAVKKDVQRMAKEIVSKSPADQSHAVLPAGTVRRESPLEQQIGTNKYREMIHEHNNKNKDLHEKLPFIFMPKRKIRSHLDVGLECPECGAFLLGSEQTYLIICSSCKNLVKPYNPEAERRGIHTDLKVGIDGTATDKLRLLEEDLAKKDK